MTLKFSRSGHSVHVSGDHVAMLGLEGPSTVPWNVPDNIHSKRLSDLFALSPEVFETEGPARRQRSVSQGEFGY